MNESIEDFVYGSTCEVMPEKEAGGWQSKRRKVQSQKIRISPIYSKNKIVLCTSKNAFISNAPIRTSLKERAWLTDIETFKSYFKLSDEMLASLLKTSRTTLDKIRRKEQTPNSSLKENIREIMSVFIEVKKMFRDKKYHARSFFYSSNDFLENKTPWEYIKEGDDYSTSDVAGLLRRMQG